MKWSSLERARVHQAEAVLIMSPSHENESSRDSHALATIMQIAHLASNENTGRAPHIVTELSNEVSKSVAEDVLETSGLLTSFYTTIWSAGRFSRCRQILNSPVCSTFF